MQKKFALGLKLGLYGNLLFIAFALVTFVYYKLYFVAPHLIVKLLEITAYAVEISGFLVFALGMYFITVTVRGRNFMKAAGFFYIAMETLMMIFEINSFAVRNFYHPYSRVLAIAHSVVSAIVCFTFLWLGKDCKKLEMMIIICIGIIFGGMFGTVLGIRVYFGIFINAVAYSILFSSVGRLNRRNDIWVECYGEKITQKDGDDYKSITE